MGSVLCSPVRAFLGREISDKIPGFVGRDSEAIASVSLCVSVVKTSGSG